MALILITKMDIIETKKHDERNWAGKLAKRKRKGVEKHIAQKRKEMASRHTTKGCKQECRLKCHENFNERERGNIFSEFWSRRSHMTKGFHCLKSEKGS